MADPVNARQNGQDKAVEALKFVDGPTRASRTQWIKSFGVIDGGLETVQSAFHTLEHKFSVRRSEDRDWLSTTDDKTPFILTGPRIHKQLL